MKKNDKIFTDYYRLSSVNGNLCSTIEMGIILIFSEINVTNTFVETEKRMKRETFINYECEAFLFSVRHH